MKTVEILTLVIVFMLIRVPLGCSEIKTHGVERIDNVNNEKVKEFLSRDIILLSPSEKGVHIIIDGRINVWGGGWQMDSVLQRGETFNSHLDHHANSKYTISKIEDSEIQIKYHNEFDHRSFGSNLITREEGNLKLKYTPQWIQTVYYGDVEEMKLLLRQGLNVNIKDAFDRTPLMIAAFYGHLEMVKLFIENGADVNAQQKEGLTALMLAVNYYSQHPKIVKLLIENEAKIDIVDKNGNNVLYYAIKYFDTFELLLDNILFIDPKELEELLRVAVVEGYSDVVRLLIDRGVNVNATVRGQSILKWACFYPNKPNTEVIKMLKTVGACE
ncbi:ankyrin repeat domain-containing protein [bacterium]|nr:ankyrin repeat domain-containing protein [bacterium]